MTHRSNLWPPTRDLGPLPPTPDVEAGGDTSTTTHRESATGGNIAGRHNAAAHGSHGSMGIEAIARPAGVSETSGSTPGGVTQVSPPQPAHTSPSRCHGANLLPDLPGEIWMRILGESDTATQRSLRASSRGTCSLVDTYTPAHLPEAVAAYWLQSGGKIPPGMTAATASAHLARLRTLETITLFGDVALNTLRGLVTRCPNLQEIDLYSKPMTWAEVRHVGLDTLASLRNLTLNIIDNDVYTPEAGLEKVFGRLRRLIIDVASHVIDNLPSSTNASVSLLALPMHALRSLQDLSLTVDVELSVDHIRSIAPPRPELLRSFSIDTAAGIEPDARYLLMQQLNKTTKLQSVALINCPLICGDIQAFASGDRSALQSLTVRNGDLGVRGAEALSCMHAPKLRSLTLEGDTLGASAALESLNLVGFPRLECLVLSGANFSEAACANLGAQAPAQVHTLLLRDCLIEGRGLRALNLDAWMSLRELDLTSNELQGPLDRAFQDPTAPEDRILEPVQFKGLLALQPDFFKSLRALVLDADSQKQVLKTNFYWSALPQLETLTLEHCNLDNDIVAGLFLADMPKLKEVNLRRNSLSAAALAAVLREKRPNLQSLDLSDCNFADYTPAPEETREVMAATWSAHVPKLEKLVLSSASLTAEKLHGLHLETIGGLCNLDLSNNALGPNALEAFESQTLSNLTHLNLQNSLTPIEDQIIRPELVVKPVSMPSLQSLSLAHTPIAEHPFVLDVSLGAVTHGGNNNLTHKFVTTTACRIGPTSIVDCDKLAEISLSRVPDLTTSRFALRAFSHLRTINLDTEQPIAPLDIVPWAAQAPRLREIVADWQAQGFLLARQYPDLFFRSHRDFED
jgi:hypothetical protein